EHIVGAVCNELVVTTIRPPEYRETICNGAAIYIWSGMRIEVEEIIRIDRMAEHRAPLVEVVATQPAAPGITLCWIEREVVVIRNADEIIHTIEVDSLSIPSSRSYRSIGEYTIVTVSGNIESGHTRFFIEWHCHNEIA